MTHRSPLRATILALGLGALVVAAPSSARAQDESLAYEGAVGVGAALCSLVYSPLKVAFAAGGVVIGSLAWLWTLGNSEVSGPIFTTAVRGDYVVTPSHLEGRRPLEFRGRGP